MDTSVGRRSCLPGQCPRATSVRIGVRLRWEMVRAHLKPIDGNRRCPTARAPRLTRAANESSIIRSGIREPDDGDLRGGWLPTVPVVHEIVIKSLIWSLFRRALG